MCKVRFQLALAQPVSKLDNLPVSVPYFVVEIGEGAGIVSEVKSGGVDKATMKLTNLFSRLPTAPPQLTTLLRVQRLWCTSRRSPSSFTYLHRDQALRPVASVLTANFFSPPLFPYRT